MEKLNNNKNKSRKGLLIPVAFFLLSMFSTHRSFSQETMMPEVSNSYLSKLIDIARNNYVIVKMSQKKIDLASINVQKAGVSWFDMFSVALNYSPNNNGYSNINQPTFAGFQIGIYLNIGSLLQKPYLIKTAKEELEYAKLGKQDALNILEGEVKARYIKFIQTSVLLRVESKIVIEAESVMKEARYKFEKGEVTFETYARAMIYESEGRRKVIDAEANLLIAKAALETIIGKKLSDIK